MELYKKYRPKELTDIAGQQAAVKILQQKLKKEFPQCCLFAGPAGTGKTTAARVCRRLLGCGKGDYREINAASSRGIDTIREIQQEMTLAPLGGKCRVYVLDEAARLTLDSQSALLKTLEDTPQGVYFILCTTDPHKLLNTIRTRCQIVVFAALGDDHIKEVVNKVAKAEGKTVSSKLANRIVECALGSARMAIQFLDKALTFDNEPDQLAAIVSLELEDRSKALCKAMMDNKPWGDVAGLLKECTDEPETIRRGILGYASKVLLNAANSPGKAARAFVVIDYFRDSTYESGAAGLYAMCYAACQKK